MDDSTDGYLYFVGIAGLATAAIIALPSYAETPQLTPATFDRSVQQVDAANAALEAELQILTDLIADADQTDPAHQRILMQRLVEARNNQELSRAAEAALLESAMLIAPDMVLVELARDVVLSDLNLDSPGEQRLWLAETRQTLNENIKRVNHTYERASRHRDEPAMRCAFNRMVQLEQLRGLYLSERTAWRDARRDGLDREADDAVERLSVIRDLADQRADAAEGCRIHYAGPAWSDSTSLDDGCRADLNAPVYDWYLGFYEPTPGCEP